jgi:hypothetical protein
MIHRVPPASSVSKIHAWNRMNRGSSLFAVAFRPVPAPAL